METQETRQPIRLAAFAFDPLKETLDLPDDLRVEKELKEPAPIIVQFKKSLTREERARIQAQYGLELADYIPEYAYLEIMTTEILEKLVADPVFRASVPYEPAFKLAPNLGKVPYRTASRKRMKGLWLYIVLFPHADPESVAKALKKQKATRIQVKDDRQIGGSASVQCVVANVAAATGIARLGEVRWIEEVAEQFDDNVNAAGTIQSGAANNPAIWHQGLHGEGQVIGLIDSGPPDINHCFFQDPVNNMPRPAHRKVLQIRNASRSAPNWHATLTSGCAAGDDFNSLGAAPCRGGSWAARLVCGNRHDIAGISSMLAELNAAAGMGAFVHTNSWHTGPVDQDNRALYNQIAADVDYFTWKNEDHLVLGSAGNIGEEQGSPGTSKNAICVGASQADPNEMNYGDGNPGPTADGRRKPDLIAPGCGIHSARLGTACGTRLVGCATSLATPHAAAAAALTRQYFTECWYPSGTAQARHAFVPSGALLKAMLLNSTIDMTGLVGYPNDEEGWGLVQLSNVLFFPGSPRDLRVWDTRNADGLLTGEIREHHVNVANNSQPLKVTLVWTEPPGAAGSANPVVNNLDLEVVSPDGTQIFRGNMFAGGVSIVGGVADTVNNVEMVLVNAPAAGEWTIRVHGTEVNVGNPGQGYALVVSAKLESAEQLSAFQYAVKFVCGRSTGDAVAPGIYFTAINVHNPTYEAIHFRKKVAVALPGERPGPVSQFFDAKLGPDQAFEIDCQDIRRHAQTTAVFLKGFVVIESDVELDVVAVYTVAREVQVESIHTERVAPRQRREERVGLPDLVPVPDPRPEIGFRRLVEQGPDAGKLVVTVKNQGDADAPASIARVTFSPGGSFDLPTPPIPAGGSVHLLPLSVPEECSMGSFTIMVDANNEVVESNEANNMGRGEFFG